MRNQTNSTRSKVILSIIGVLIITALACLGKIVEDVKNENIVINQVPVTGSLEFWTTPGMKFQRFGRTTTYFKTNQIWFNEVITTDKGNLLPGEANPAFPITYSDKGKGFLLGSVRIELPTNESQLNLIQQHYGNERRLIEELIKPTIGKVILACGPLMTSLESVSEKRNDLIYYATDQLNSGVYATKAKTIERLNSITNEMEKIQQAEIVTDSLGNPKRQEVSPFSTYGLKVSQLAIADLLYEPATNDQISKQRTADMDIITAKAEAAKAIQKTIQIEEEGKQAATAARWKQLEIKEVEVTKAQQAFEVAKYQAQEADEKAKKILAEGRAEAESNRLKVQAGLTPQEKA